MTMMLSMMTMCRMSLMEKMRSLWSLSWKCAKASNCPLENSLASSSKKITTAFSSPMSMFHRVSRASTLMRRGHYSAFTKRTFIITSSTHSNFSTYGQARRCLTLNRWWRHLPKQRCLRKNAESWWSLSAWLMRAYLQCGLVKRVQRAACSTSRRQLSKLKRWTKSSQVSSKCKRRSFTTWR